MSKGRLAFTQHAYSIKWRFALEKIRALANASIFLQRPTLPTRWEENFSNAQRSQRVGWALVVGQRTPTPNNSNTDA